MYLRSKLRAQDAWALRDEWALVGHGLDFVDEEDAKASTPDVTVVPRPAGGGRKRGDADENTRQTLANTVFVAADGRRRRNSSQHSSSSSSSAFSSLPPYPYSRHSGGGSSGGTFKSHHGASSR